MQGEKITCEKKKQFVSFKDFTDGWPKNKKSDLSFEPVRVVNQEFSDNYDTPIGMETKPTTEMLSLDENNILDLEFVK